MKRITNISQLKPGNKIFTINHYGSAEILEFREIHPHHDGYSLFLNENQDGMQKFYNKTLEEKEYYLYEDSDVCWKFIYEREIATLKRRIDRIEERMARLPSERKSKTQKVEKLNKATIEFTSERGDFRIIINDQVREKDDKLTMPKGEMHKLARSLARVACLCYEACERDFEEE